MIKNSIKFIFLITLLFVLINVFYIQPETKAFPTIQNEALTAQAISLTPRIAARSQATATIPEEKAETIDIGETTEVVNVEPEVGPTPVKVDPEAVIPALVDRSTASRPVNTSSEPMAPAGVVTTGSSMGSFRATAYCLKGRTANGGSVRRGVVAADPRVLPLGSKIQVNAGSYSGTYTVTDTGGAIKGKILDVWVPSCGEANKFGRRTVQVTVHSRPAGKAAPARKAKK